MKARTSRALASASKIIGAAVLSTVLVACGGGTSGDDLDGDLDTDIGDGLDGEFEGDNLDSLGEENALVDPLDVDGNGVLDSEEGSVCKGRGGSDPDSSNNAWNDNCWLESFVSGDADGDGFVNGPFFNSTYVQGMQRVLACREHAGVGVSDTATINDWADGLFGPGTVTALREFQTAEGLTSDGIVGPETWGRLQELVYDPANRVAADSDEVFNGYGVTRVAEPNTNIDCSQVTSFYGRFATEAGAEDLFDSWQIAVDHGSLVVGPFSVDPVE